MTNLADTFTRLLDHVRPVLRLVYQKIPELRCQTSSSGSARIAQTLSEGILTSVVFISVQQQRQWQRHQQKHQCTTSSNRAFDTIGDAASALPPPLLPPPVPLPPLPRQPRVFLHTCNPKETVRLTSEAHKLCALLVCMQFTGLIVSFIEGVVCTYNGVWFHCFLGRQKYGSRS